MFESETRLRDPRTLETENFFVVRREVDGLAAALAARRTGPGGLASLWVAHRNLADAMREGDRLGMVSWNVQFHEELYALARSRPIRWIGGALLLELARFTLLPVTSPSGKALVLAQHEAILRALESGSADRARRAAEIHIETMRVRWLEATAPSQLSPPRVTHAQRAD